jgi:hypothetical protein
MWRKRDHIAAPRVRTGGDLVTGAFVTAPLGERDGIRLRPPPQGRYRRITSCLSNDENDECEKIAGILSAETVLRSRAGVRHLMANPSVSALANADKLTKLAREWLGRYSIPRDTFENGQHELVDTVASG